MPAIHSTLPYHPISRFYRDRFQTKVHKVSVAVAETCPNREGLNGMRTCNFCDQWGSAAYHENLQKPLLEQIANVREKLRSQRGAKKFLIYFQAYTTTFSRQQRLREQFLAALAEPDVVGLVVGTRPDCISQSFLEICHELAEKTFMGIELGVQSFDDETLKWMRRGHNGERSLKALRYIAQVCPQVNLSVHLIFGSPNETDAMVIDAAKRINDEPVHSVKLHHLHVLRDTPLHEEYARGDFKPLEREDYFHRCCLFLQHLRPDIAVHRLAAFAPRWEELVAPQWSSYKMKTYQDMLDFMLQRGAYQGQNLS